MDIPSAALYLLHNENRGYAYEQFHRSGKPPLCKGRWPSVVRTEGL